MIKSFNDFKAYSKRTRLQDKKNICFATGAASYIVRIVGEVDYELIIMESTDKNQFSFTNLLPGTVYNIYITSVGFEGQISEENFIISEATCNLFLFINFKHIFQINILLKY